MDEESELRAAGGKGWSRIMAEHEVGDRLILQSRVIAHRTVTHSCAVRFGPCLGTRAQRRVVRMVQLCRACFVAWPGLLRFWAATQQQARAFGASRVSRQAQASAPPPAAGLPRQPCLRIPTGRPRFCHSLLPCSGWHFMTTLACQYMSSAAAASTVRRRLAGGWLVACVAGGVLLCGIRTFP